MVLPARSASQKYRFNRQSARTEFRPGALPVETVFLRGGAGREDHVLFLRAGAQTQQDWGSTFRFKPVYASKI